MSEYGNVELSDPQYERDHLRYLTFKSPALKRRGDVTIFVPPGCERKDRLPVVMLLHGVYGSHWSWSMKGGAHLTALNLIEKQLIEAIVLCMPSDGLWGDGSGYIAHAEADYEGWIMEDVIGCVTKVIPCIDSRSLLFIAGLSMGGYGALRLGAKYAEKVAGFSGHSSITDPNQLATLVEEPLAFFGETLEREDARLLYWMKRQRESLPPFRFDCGTSDALIEKNRELHQALFALNIPHQYFEYEGGHDWDYWREHIADTLIFFDSVCKAREPCLK
ncbi:MAG: esterase family protein [Pyrinomonadaceae bacterium]|nr:esterase family protein [Pyrinomonadaceae bacterium]